MTSVSLLPELFEQLPHVNNDSERVAWLTQWLLWFEKSHALETRFRYFLNVLEKNPQYYDFWKKAFPPSWCARHLGLLDSTSFERGFFSELAKRFLTSLGRREKLKPPFLTEFLCQLVKTPADMEFFMRSDEIILIPLVKLVSDSHENQRDFKLNWLKQIRRDGFWLHTQILYHAERVGLHTLYPDTLVDLSRFATALERDLFDQSSTPEHDRSILESGQKTLESLQQQLALHALNLESEGILISEVYHLEKIESLLEPLRNIISMLHSHLEDQSLFPVWKNYFAKWIVHQQEDRKLSSFLQTNLHLVAKTLTSRLAEKGEHYFAKSYRQLFSIFKKAWKGGLITFVTAYLKIKISSWGLPLFIEAFLIGLNYFLSFTAIYLVGGILATKMPANTAPALAHRISHIKKREKLGELIEEVAAFSRAQFMAVLGNLSGIIPLSLSFSIAWMALVKEPLLPQEKGLSLLHSLDPIGSFTFFYAMETGLVLFLSAILAGYLENMLNRFHIPKQLKDWQTTIQSVWLKKALYFIEKHMSALLLNGILGFGLAFTSMWGQFLGLPLDVRHVTLSAGFWALGWTSLWGSPMSSSSLILQSAFGIVVIGFFNFWLSFLCAMSLAAFAQNLRSLWVKPILHALKETMKKQPLRFFLPISWGEPEN